MDINKLKKKGLIIEWKGELWEIKNFQHTRRPGRGGVFVKTELKNLETGERVNKNFIEADNFKIAEISRLKAVYLYRKGETFFFMSLSDYQEIALPQKLIEEKEKFLKQGQEVEILFSQIPEKKAINLILPKKVKLKVVKAPEAVKGNSANSPTKDVVLETGFKISVPLFIKEGDEILINTETGQYGERTN